MMSLRRRVHLVALLACAMAAGPATGATDTRALLERMAEAMRTQSYEGTLVYQHNGKIESMSLVHGFVEGQERERLSALSGEPFEVIRSGDTVTCVWPQTNRVLISRRPGDLLPPKPPRDLAEVPEMYSVESHGTQRVAGRDAYVVGITPKDDLRHGYRMWIDADTGLLLRSDMLAPDGSMVERLMFTDMQSVANVAPERFRPSVEGAQYTEHEGAESAGARLESPSWIVGDMPAGFRVVSHRRQAMPPHGMAVQHSVFTDGLASVSVFVEPPTADSMPLKGPSRMGAVNAFGRRVEGHQVTVVGEVPAVTVRRIAQSVRRADGAGQ